METSQSDFSAFAPKSRLFDFNPNQTGQRSRENPFNTDNPLSIVNTDYTLNNPNLSNLFKEAPIPFDYNLNF